jgi:hypothetical protein
MSPLSPEVADQVATMWEGEVAGENRALTLVVTGVGGVMRRSLDEGNVVAAITDPLVLLRGKP